MAKMQPQTKENVLSLIEELKELPILESATPYSQEAYILFCLKGIQEYIEGEK
jgi:hypothetical protein